MEHCAGAAGQEDSVLPDPLADPNQLCTIHSCRSVYAAILHVFLGSWMRVAPRIPSPFQFSQLVLATSSCLIMLTL